jgi:hypothetical protein
MGLSFDPYHKWLGIPPEEQPPNHYRLLGIKVFETDPDVIEAAADQRMAHLRGYQTGRHAELSQRLLNEVAAARICLLNTTKRAVYDEELKATVESPTAPVDLEPSGSAFPLVDDEWSPKITHPKASRLARRKSTSKAGPIIAGVVAAGLAVVIGLVWLILSRDAPSASASGARSVATQPEPTKKTLQKVPPSLSKTDRLPERPAAPMKKPVGPDSAIKAVAPLKAAEGPEHRRENPLPKPVPLEKAVLKVDSEPVAGPDAVAKQRGAEGEEPHRTAAPKAAEQAAAMKQVKELYRDDIAMAKTPQQRKTLALKLLDQARREEGGAGAGTFALLSLGRDMAVQTGDVAAAIQAVDAMAERFEVNGVELKADALSELAKKARDSSDQLRIAREAVGLMEDATEAGDFTRAAHLGKLAVAEGGKAHDRDIVVDARGRLKKVQTFVRLNKEFETARTTLADQPDDQAANTTAAEYYCLLWNDWEKGLPHLAKGRDATLKALAKQELEESPTDAEKRVKLADAWWDLAQKADSKWKSKMLLHAGWWYAKAQTALPAGMTKLKVEKRLDEIEKLDRKAGLRLAPGL